METKGTEAIKTFGIIISKNENGILTVDFGTDDNIINKKSVLISPNAPLLVDKEIFVNGSKMSQDDLDKLDPNEIESMDVIKKSDKATIRVVTKKFSKTLNDNDIYINDKKSDKKELLLLDQNTIDKMDVSSNDKTIRITTKTVTQSFDGADIPPPPPPTSTKMIQKDKTVGKKALIVINGKRTEATMADLSDVDNNLIKSMNVLKGKSAIEKYGKDGENDVIEIFTKENVDLLKSSNRKDK